MTQTELILASRLLNLAANEFCNHGCNDIASEIWDGISEDEINRLTIAFEKRNSAMMDYDAGRNLRHYPDAAVMDYLAFRLMEDADLEIRRRESA